MNGFKFLDPTGATYHNGNATIYPLPGPGEKWGPELVHPNPAEPDGSDCGPGRYHIMKRPTNPYGPRNWWPWYVVSTGETIGESSEKFGTAALKLRRISPAVWHRIIRLGWCRDANLRGANLRGADLRYADLRGADLRGADLRGADLRYAAYNTYTRWPEGFDCEKAVAESYLYIE
jgi:hypothetical protein